MVTLDIAILAVIGLSAMIGLVRGFVKEALSLVGWVVAFVLAILFYEQLAQIVPSAWGGQTVRNGIAFIGIVVGALIAAAILRWFVGVLVESTGLSGTDRFLGFLFGAARGALLIVIALMLVDEFVDDRTWWQEARLPPEFLAFEDEVKDLLGRTGDLVEESGLIEEGTEQSGI